MDLYKIGAEYIKVTAYTKVVNLPTLLLLLLLLLFFFGPPAQSRRHEN